MGGVITGFITVGAVIGLGALLAHVGFFTESAGAFLSRLAFFVGSPALLLTTIANTPVAEVFSRHLLATLAGVLATGMAYVLVNRLFWHRRAGEEVIGALATSYVNAGNLGLPIAAYVLGNVSYAAPTLLLQLLVLQPSALGLLDADRTGRPPRLLHLLRSALTNPLTLGALGGLALSLGGWQLPTFLASPIQLVAGVAVPAMLLAYGIALRLGPKLGGGVDSRELATTTALKSIGQPLVATAAAVALGLSGPALLAVAVMSALPTAQNIYVIAARYDRATTLARDTILLTTGLSVPVIVIIALLLG
ncbi:MAG: AEC family transporter [Nostocoides sp.]